MNTDQNIMKMKKLENKKILNERLVRQKQIMKGLKCNNINFKLGPNGKL